MKRFDLCVLLLLLVVNVDARAFERSDTTEVKIYFRQGHSSFDGSFRRNGLRWEAFRGTVRSLMTDPAVRVDRIRITGGASPEGNTDVQKVLSSRRADNISDLADDAATVPCDVVSLGIDWEGLTRMVEASDMPYRSRVLHILRDTPEWIRHEGVVVDGRKRQLQMLEGGRAWHYMEDRFFPELRRVRVELFYATATDDKNASVERADDAQRATVDTVVLCHRDTVVLVHRDTIMVTASRPTFSFCMALKTNLLYDIALVPNVGAEFHLGRGWSLGAGGMYGWWKNDRKHRYWRIYGGEFDIRKYFGRRAGEQPLTGHHLGIYGQVMTYDFETGGRGYMGGQPGGTLFDKAHWGIGIEYGYSVALGRRLNLDFSLGIGYLGGEYMEYVPADSHYVWQSTHHRDWFGPTKAEISLVWRLGPGAIKEKKGGKR